MNYRDEQPEDDMDLAHHSRGESSDDVRDFYDYDHSACSCWACFTGGRGSARDDDYDDDRSCQHEWCVEQGEEPGDDREVCMLCGAIQFPYG